VSASSIQFSGRCLCGSVQFEGHLQASEAVAVHCHCKDCQRATGSGFATVIAVPADELRVTGDVAEHTVVGATGGEVSREFCPACGSPMFTVAALSPGLRFVKAGVLDDSSWVQPAMACWTESREPWCIIEEGLPEVAQNPNLADGAS